MEHSGIGLRGKESCRRAFLPPPKSPLVTLDRHEGFSKEKKYKKTRGAEGCVTR
jgi:hypothetical protein